MDIQIWTLENCPRCTAVKNALSKQEMDYTVLDMKALQKGDILDVDAMAQLVMTDGVAPMVRVGERFLDDDEIESLLQGKLPDELHSFRNAPKDIRVGNRALSVEEHHKILAMTPEQVRETFHVKNPEELIERVRKAVVYWEGGKHA
jgi:glutaredoxin-related protein